MPRPLLASKIVIVEEPPRIVSAPALPTAVVAVVGVTERGPIGEATLVTSFDEYVNIFGGFTADSEVALAAHLFFLNGGQFLWVSRTVHYSDNTNPASQTAAKGTLTLQTGATAEGPGETTGSIVAPWLLASGDTLNFSIINDGGPAATPTATFTGVAPQRDSGAETFALSNGQTLTLKVNQGAVQTVTFLTGEFASIGAATAAEVAAVINAKTTGVQATVVAGPAVRIKTDKKGTGAYIEVTGGTANGALGFTTGQLQGTGNVADIENVTANEALTIINAALGADGSATQSGGAITVVSDGVGTDSSAQVLASSSADGKFGFDNAVHAGTSGAAVDTLRVDAKWFGAYAANIQPRIKAASSGSSGEFNLEILENGLIAESFPNLTLDDSLANFAETVVNDPDNGSRLVQVEDVFSGPGTAVQKRPANSTTSLSALAGGDDGLSGLADADFIGSQAGPTGLYTFDQTEDCTLLIVPGRATAGVHDAMITYCEVARDGLMFAVLDIPQGSSAVQAVTYTENTAALLERTEHAAIYWPWVKIVNPNASVFGADANITVAPAGGIVGIYARNDAANEGGIYQSPAGLPNGIFFGAVGLETNEALDERKRDIVYPKRINPITAARGVPIHIDGGRTLKATGNFPNINERRGVIHIERTLKALLRFAKHKNNDAELRQQVSRTTFNFLLRQMKLRAFRTQDPKTAFFVDVSDALNPPSAQAAGILTLRVGLATNKPAEFIVIRVTQDTRALEEELAAAQG